MTDGFPTNIRQQVVPVERSETRGFFIPCRKAPGFAALYPGYDDSLVEVIGGMRIAIQSQPGICDPSRPPVSNTAVRVPPAFTGNSIDASLVLRNNFHNALSLVMNMAMASSVSGRQASIDFGAAPSAITFTL